MSALDPLETPKQAVWGALVGVKRGGSHRFLRSAFGGQVNRPRCLLA
jgi:hypothetical protein